MRRENKKGITLIALVITIIVLLVLAGVSLSLTLGENGVLSKAKNATTETRIAEQKEKIEMAVAAARAAGNGVLNKDNLDTELDKLFDNVILDKETEQGWSYSISDKKYNIDRTGKLEEQNSLIPSEYQLIEYIEETGGQYIDTRLSMPQGFHTELDLMQTSKTSGLQFILGAEDASPYNRNYIKFNGSSWEIGNYGCPVVSSTVKLNERYYVDFCNIHDNIFLIVNDKNIYSTNSQLPARSGKNLYMFKINASGFESYKFYGRIYSCKIYSSPDYENIVRDYYPCYSTTTVTDVNGKQCLANTKGLYDLVEGKFYTNQGTGDFIAGPDV